MKNNIIDKVEFGKRLKSLMDEYHENTYSLGGQFNLTPSSISRYTRGEIIPKITTVNQFADYFDVNPEWLMGYPVSKYTYEILESDHSEFYSTTDVKVYDHINFHKPLFSNHCIKEKLSIPSAKRLEWGPGIAYKISDDSMAPQLLPGDLVMIKLNTELQSENLMALHADKGDLIIRKLILPDDSHVILQPQNPTWDAEVYPRHKIQIIGQIVFIRRLSEWFFE